MAERRVLSTIVTEAFWLTPGMVRIVVGGPDLEGFGVGAFTDHYVKCRFGEDALLHGALLGSRAAPAHARLRRPRRPRPRRPWAANAKPGDTLQLAGPGGAYTPSPDADWHLLVGDDAALPAIAVSLARVPAGVPAFAVVEVDGPEHRQPLDPG